MPTQAALERAKADVKRKIALEIGLKEDLTVFFRRVAGDIEQGREWDTPATEATLLGLLLAQYDDTWMEFSADFRAQFGMAEGATGEQIDQHISAFREQFFPQLAEASVASIMETTRGIVGQLYRLAAEQTGGRGEQLEPTTGGLVEPQADEFPAPVLAAIAGAFLLTVDARAQTIAQTETQVAAEYIKASEIDALVYTGATVDGVTVSPFSVKKEWVGILDSRIRPTHLQADGQIVFLNDPFIVGGSKMMHPGDTSLGAPPQEIINCRCVAIYRF